MYVEIKTKAAMTGQQLLSSMRQRYGIYGGMSHSLPDADEATASFDLSPNDLSDMVKVLQKELEADFTVTIEHWQ